MTNQSSRYPPVSDIIIPLWQRGIKEDFKMMVRKSSPSLRPARRGFLLSSVMPMICEAVVLDEGGFGMERVAMEGHSVDIPLPLHFF